MKPQNSCGVEIKRNVAVVDPQKVGKPNNLSGIIVSLQTRQLVSFPPMSNMAAEKISSIGSDKLSINITSHQPTKNLFYCEGYVEDSVFFKLRIEDK